MKQALLLGGALAAMLTAAPLIATADEATPVTATQIADTATNANGEVDAGKLIGEEVYDASGDKVGEIDSVMVDQKGKVSSVVIDVSGWLESEKLVAVKWSDLKTGEDGKIVSSLTKDSAKQAAAYTYKDKSLRGKVMTESGEPYAVNAPSESMQPAAGSTAAVTGTNTGTDNAAGTAATTGTATGTGTAAANNTPTDNALVNADGSLNASKLIGLDVKSPEDKKVGDIGEVVLDKDGKAQGVVVDVGGFLGIATHPVLLDWKDVKIANQDGKATATVDLTKDKLEQLPAYESSSK
jgi:sporulation protein YlmC with PRC-barrel domain